MGTLVALVREEKVAVPVHVPLVDTAPPSEPERVDSLNQCHRIRWQDVADRSLRGRGLIDPESWLALTLWRVEGGSIGG